MRANPIQGFFLLLSGQLGDQISAGSLRWVMVALYWLLLVAGVAIAVDNWRRDPPQRTFRHVFVGALRFLAAGMWYTGSLWKLPLPVSQGFKFWMESTVKYSSWAWHAAIMQVFLNHITVIGPLVFLLEVGLTASLMLGFLVRLSSIVGALFILNLLIGLFNDPTEWVWTYVGLIGTFAMFAVDQAGRSLGLDNLLAKRLLPVFEDDSMLIRLARKMS